MKSEIKQLTRGEKLRRIRAAMKVAGLRTNLRYSEARPGMNMQRVKYCCSPAGGWAKFGENKALIHAVAMTMFPDCLFCIDEEPARNNIRIRLFTKLETL